MSIYKNTERGPSWVAGTEMVRCRPSSTFGRRRVCAAPGCPTRLSIYNPTTRCSIHDHPLH
jgi:hypothetical protein